LHFEISPRAGIFRRGEDRAHSPSHTTEIFGDSIFTYAWQAVIGGYLIDHEPPVLIESALGHLREYLAHLV
jgi:hypothetical protein